MKKFLLILALLFLPFTTFAQVEITEIMYDLEGSDSNREWIEIFNNSSSTVDLTGWKLFEAETNHKLTGDLTLTAGSYAVIVVKETNFRTDNPSYSGLLIDSSFSLKNSGESLAIKDDALTIIDEVTYDTSLGGNGNGNTLEKVNNVWQESTTLGGTPGKANATTESEQESTGTTTPPPVGSIPNNIGSINQPPIPEAGSDLVALVNTPLIFDASKTTDPENNILAFTWNFGDGVTANKEVAEHSYLFPGTYIATLMVSDGHNLSKDTITITIYPGGLIINEIDPKEGWVEILNTSLAIIDLSNWGLNNFVFPLNSFIYPENYLAIPNILIEDNLKLTFPNGGIAQEVVFENTPNNSSVSRVASGNYYWSHFKTPGGPNIIRGLPGTEESGSVTLNTQKPKVKTTKFQLINVAYAQKVNNLVVPLAPTFQTVTPKKLPLMANILDSLPFTILPSVLTTFLTVGVLALLFRKRLFL